MEGSGDRLGLDTLRLATGIVLILAGSVWVLQGLDANFVPSSAMTGNRVWVLWGGVAIALGAVLIWRHKRQQ